MFSRDQILQALSRVIHPEKKKDIVSLGMISEVNYTEKGISLTLTPEKSNDPFITSIKSTIVRTIKYVLAPDAVVNEIIVQPKVVVGKVHEKPREVLPLVSNIIAVASGKGGVG